MVKFDQFFGMVAKSDFDGPLQIHYEYPLGGANNGSANTDDAARGSVGGDEEGSGQACAASMAQAGL